MAEIKKVLEEKLRESACFGNLELLEELIRKGVDVNSKNNINGWTALHWAAYRNNLDAVALLLRNGADKTCLTNKKELPSNLSMRSEIQMILGGVVSLKKPPILPIIPNYLKNPPLCTKNVESSLINNVNQFFSCSEVLVLKVKMEQDLDFVEIELPKSDLSFEKLKLVCSKELCINLNNICKIRKLPNTLLRKDKDVQRLKDFQELEVIVFEIRN